MTEKIYAHVNPVILVWARTQAGLDASEAAHKAGVSEEKFFSWEAGDSLPTLRQLRQLARAYRRPTAFFYLDETPPSPPDIPDFRATTLRDKKRSPDLLEEIRRARFRREIALEVLHQLEQPVPDFLLRLDQAATVEESASAVRAFLGISIKDQCSWKKGNLALNKWAEATEKQGAFIFQFSRIKPSISRGFSIRYDKLPVIALNGADRPKGRVFTLFHELVHLGLGESALCDLREGAESIEVLCNAIAGQALVPSHALLDQKEVRKHSGREWDDKTLRSLASLFSVSREVILRRLLSLGLTTTTFYKQKRKDFSQEYKKLEDETKKDGFFWYHKKVVRDNGRAYSGLVVNAYEQRLISAVELSRYLGDINLSHFESIRQELG